MWLKILILAYLVFGSAITLNCAYERPLMLGKLLPDDLNGWQALTQTGPDKTYDRTTLYDYIDGAAEPYLTFQFRQVVARRYEKEGQPSIVVDLFDMGSSKDAYGLFSFHREEEDAPPAR